MANSVRSSLPLLAAPDAQRSAVVHIMEALKKVCVISPSPQCEEFIDIASHDETASCSLSCAVHGVFPGSMRSG